MPTHAATADPAGAFEQFSGQLRITDPLLTDGGSARNGP